MAINIALLDFRLIKLDMFIRADAWKLRLLLHLPPPRLASSLFRYFPAVDEIFTALCDCAALNPDPQGNDSAQILIPSPCFNRA